MIALLGRPDYPTDGIADYCSFLAQALSRRGVDLKIVRFPVVEKGWLRPLWQLRKTSTEWRGKWVLLQYTALGWSRRGFPFSAVAAVLLMRTQGVRCSVIFHEPFRQGTQTHSWKNSIRGAFQDWVIRSLHRLSLISIFTIPLDSIPWLPKNRNKCAFIPLGPNLPEYIARPAETRERTPARNGAMTVAVFCVSDIPHREKELSEISHAMCSATASVPDLRIVFLGRGAREAQDDIARAFAGIPVEISNLGICPLDQVSRVLGESDAMLCVRGQLNLRRGSALAGIACAVPILGYSGAAEGTPLLDAGIEFVPEGDKEALGAALTRVLTDPALRQSLREKSLRVHQQHFSWDSIAASFLHSLGNVRAEG